VGDAIAALTCYRLTISCVVIFMKSVIHHNITVMTSVTGLVDILHSVDELERQTTFVFVFLGSHPR